MLNHPAFGFLLIVGSILSNEGSASLTRAVQWDSVSEEDRLNEQLVESLVILLNLMLKKSPNLRVAYDKAFPDDLMPEDARLMRERVQFMIADWLILEILENSDLSREQIANMNLSEVYAIRDDKLRSLLLAAKDHVR